MNKGNSIKNKTYKIKNKMDKKVKIAVISASVLGVAAAGYFGWKFAKQSKNTNKIIDAIKDPSAVKSDVAELTKLIAAAKSGVVKPAESEAADNMADTYAFSTINDGKTFVPSKEMSEFNDSAYYKKMLNIYTDARIKGATHEQGMNAMKAFNNATFK